MKTYTAMQQDTPEFNSEDIYNLVNNSGPSPSIYPVTPSLTLLGDSSGPFSYFFFVSMLLSVIIGGFLAMS